MTDLERLCRDLATLHRALTAAGTPAGRLDDPSSAGRLVAATLTPTPRRDHASSRRIPASRPPADLHLLDTRRRLETTVRALTADLRAALDHTTVDRHIPAALRAIASHLPALDDTHPLHRRIPAVLGRLAGTARAVLDLDERWLPLGPCPEIWQTAEPVAWDAAGKAVAYVDDVRGCHTYDPAASYEASRRRGAPVDIWVRSHIRIPRDVDILDATAVCLGCNRRWTPADRARLVAIVERRAVEQLAAAG